AHSGTSVGRGMNWMAWGLAVSGSVESVARHSAGPASIAAIARAVSADGSRRSLSHSGERPATNGGLRKLNGGGGEEMLHSKVSPPHGSSPGGAPRFRLWTRFATNTKNPAPSTNAPKVAARFIPSRPSDSG